MSDRGKMALVLSAGGMFGAYQAGAWSLLASRFQPEIIVGASIGSLNAWAIAGNVKPAELIERWTALEYGAHPRWRIPINPLHGVLDPATFEKAIRELHDSYRPSIRVGIVLTELARRRPRLFETEAVTWRHLAASCAVPCLFPPYHIDGRIYCDGGLLNALPLWAAIRMGATHIIAVNAWTPAWWVAAIARTLRLGARRRTIVPAGVRIITIAPGSSLGTMRDALYWTRRNAGRWIEQGRRDAEHALLGEPTLQI